MKKINHYLALFFILFLAVTLPAVASANTNVSGIITTDTTWTLSNSPYIVTGNVLVNSGVTLTVEPGVVVRFDSGVALQIDGTLIAIGTYNDNITFTSNQSVPAAGDWAYIFFSDSSTDAAYDADGNYTGGSILEYCVIEYAGSAGSALQMDNAHPFVNYCIIKDNSELGINASNLTETFKITNSGISNNTGGIFVSGGSVYISYNTISNNGGSYVDEYGITQYYGKVLYVSGVVATISHNTISDNFASYGGGIYVNSSSTTITTICDNTISNNASSGSGGGIYFFGRRGTTTICNNIISSNTSNSYGGGMSVAVMTATIFNNTIESNTAADGGGIYVLNDDIATAVIYNNTISNNTVSRNGGGISVYGSATTISSNTIGNNTASLSGGGLYLSDGYYINPPAATITSNSIIGNSAENASAVYYYGSGTEDFKNNTITDNIATGAAPTYTVSIKGNPLLNYNDILNNTATYELWNSNAAGSANVDATNNWWGTSIESEIQTKIYDWFDDSSKGIVDYYPYLDSPVTTPDISISPASHDFGSVDAGLSVSRTFTISNTGTAELIIKAVYLTGTNPYQFSIQSENCSYVAIAPSVSCTVDVVFSPTKAGALSAVLGVGSNDPDTPRLYIALSGTGVTDGVPDISASPASKDFGSLNVGASSSQTFTISNTGTADLTIKAVYLTGENPYQFSIQNENCRGAIIAPAGSCTVEIMFSPTKEGGLNAILGIGSNDPDTPRLYTKLNGTGVGVGVPDISADPASKDFGSVEEECSIVSQTFTISNTGTADLMIRAVYLTGENPYQFSIQNENCRGAVIAPAGSCTVEVMFNPTKTGALSAILGIGSNDPDTPRLYTRLSGTGVATAGISEIVSYWKFDDGSGLTAADSADANDGTLINDPQWTTGIVGGALSFDGADDYVSVPDAVNLHITDELTIEAWILKPDDYVQVLANKNSSFTLSAGPGDMIQFNLKEQDGAGVTVGFSGSIPQNEWTHIAVTYNGKCMRAYVDGDRVGYYPLTLTIETSTDNLLIGRRLVGTPTYFKGIIDEVAIYNGALTQEELKQHYQNGLNGLGY